MAVAINKSIELNSMGGVTASYWKILGANINIPSAGVHVTLVPFLNQVSDSGGRQPAFAFVKTYELTFPQAGLNTSQTGNQLRDTILTWILNNEPDFAGGTLV